LPATVQNILQYNPTYHFVNYFRQTTLYGTVPSLRLNVICAAFSLGALTLGLAVFKKAQDKFILHI
jgi:ABC-2 type transport system permease protein